MLGRIAQIVRNQRGNLDRVGVRRNVHLLADLAGNEEADVNPESRKMYESSNELLKLTQKSSVRVQTHARILTQYTPRVEQF